MKYLNPYAATTSGDHGAGANAQFSGVKRIVGIIVVAQGTSRESSITESQTDAFIDIPYQLAILGFAPLRYATARCTFTWYADGDVYEAVGVDMFPAIDVVQPNVINLVVVLPDVVGNLRQSGQVWGSSSEVINQGVGLVVE